MPLCPPKWSILYSKAVALTGPPVLKIPSYCWFKIWELAKPWFAATYPRWEDPITCWDIIKLLVWGLLIPFWLWIVLTPYWEFWIPDELDPIEPMPPIPAGIFCWPNYLIVLGLLESFPETLGLFPLSLTMPPLIPMMAWSPFVKF